MQAPLLSVITPALDSAAFIEATLDSVASLPFAVEHIVVDACSTDGTVEILRDRGDESLEWTSEPDRGQTHAVNKGLARAGGKYVAWLNADDAYIPGNVKNAIDALEADPGLDAVFGFMEVVDAGGRFQRLYRCGPFSWNRYLFAGDYVPTPTIIFRRTLLGVGSELNESYRDAADYDFYLRLLRHARVRRLRIPLVRFRYHEASKTGSNLDLQNAEAMEIRLGLARNGLERRAMVAIRRMKGLRERFIPSWPEADNP